jgi:putative N6-adenine-specific DNA methylase
MKIIAKTFKGLEEVLAGELINLGANDVQIERRAVSCKGDRRLLYKANLCCRTASRLLVPIAEFKAKNADEIYENAKNIDWSKFLDVKNTFSIDSTVFSEQFTHSKFVAYRLKDAIADHFTEKTGKRPSVSLTDPDLMLNIHIAGTNCTVSLDSSGESLHKRGYRTSQTEAPINEALAAGILLLAGWDGSQNFIDPMCGSGTFLIEAALIALNIPPGIFRKSFAFEKWQDFDPDLFDEIYNDDSNERDFDFHIYGSDIAPQAIKIAEQNVKSAGLSRYISLQKADIAQLEVPEGKMLMVSNPPYGERLQSENLMGIYSTIGRMLKHKMMGNKAWIISSDERCLAAIGMKPFRKIDLFNGNIDCLLYGYEIFAGKRNNFVKEWKERK